MPPPSWQIELDQLRTTNASLLALKSSAESDRELFHDLYNKASAHASSVSAENNALVERVSIVESRLSDGLTMVKATYEARVERLEEEVQRLKGINQVLGERDEKMEGDDVRKARATVEELRGENQKMRAEMAQLRLDYHRLQRSVNMGMSLSEPAGTQVSVTSTEKVEVKVDIPPQ